MSDNHKLKPHRDAIDSIDSTILRLLNERAAHAHAIGELKGSRAVYRPEREAEVLRRIQSLNRGPLPDETVARLFREIMSECLAMERPLTITYLGPQGTFTEQAAIKHFGHAAHTQPCASIDDCFHQVEARQADYAVVPVENSTEGSVGRSLDLLVSTPLQACGEVVLRIHHHLLRSVAHREGISKVYAHAQALAQCHDWLNNNLPDTVARISVSSNAEAARLAAEETTAAAIASQMAAERYRLTQLANNIEDEPNNTTRFLILGHRDTESTGHDKTSLIVSAPNKAGAIHHLLQPFSAHGVSMTKLESRPSRAGLWAYVFFIDIEGHRHDKHIQSALDDLSERAAFIKLIGSYPTAVL